MFWKWFKVGGIVMALAVALLLLSSTSVVNKTPQTPAAPQSMFKR